MKKEPEIPLAIDDKILRRAKPSTIARRVMRYVFFCIPLVLTIFHIVIVMGQGATGTVGQYIIDPGVSVRLLLGYLFFSHFFTKVDDPSCSELVFTRRSIFSVQKDTNKVELIGNYDDYIAFCVTQNIFEKIFDIGSIYVMRKDGDSEGIFSVKDFKETMSVFRSRAKKCVETNAKQYRKLHEQLTRIDIPIEKEEPIVVNTVSGYSLNKDEIKNADSTCQIQENKSEPESVFSEEDW